MEEEVESLELKISGQKDLIDQMEKEKSRIK